MTTVYARREWERRAPPAGWVQRPGYVPWNVPQAYHSTDRKCLCVSVVLITSIKS